MFTINSREFKIKVTKNDENIYTARLVSEAGEELFPKTGRTYGEAKRELYRTLLEKEIREGVDNLLLDPGKLSPWVREKVIIEARRLKYEEGLCYVDWRKKMRTVFPSDYGVKFYEKL